MNSAISLRHIVKRYRRARDFVAVLQDFSLDIRQGEFIALAGPSGAGKTTILNLIAGLDRSEDGEIIVAGEHLERLSGEGLARWRGRHIGFVFQFYNLLPMLSAAENIELPLLLTRQSRAERKRRVSAALEMVELTDRASHKPGELSGGQQQRVGIARAIIADPPILLCDEPTGDLDRPTADGVLSLLRALNRRTGKTIVMVTHDETAANHAGRRLHLDKGVLADAGPGALA